MLPSLIDRLGDAKDSVREQDQALLLKIMDQAANPQVRLGCSCKMSMGFREKKFIVFHLAPLSPHRIFTDGVPLNKLVTLTWVGSAWFNFLDSSSFM